MAKEPASSYDPEYPPPMVAEWKSSPPEVDKLNVRGPLVRLTQANRLSSWRGVALVGMAVSSPAIVAQFFVDTNSIGGLIVKLGMALFALNLAAVLALKTAAERTWNRSVPEKEIDTSAGAVPVKIGLFCNGVQYASDMAEVVHVEGWLLFEGSRTQFSLSLRDVDFRRNSLSRGSRTSREISLARPESHVAILVTSPHGDDLEYLIGRWKRRILPSPGIAVLPPLEPDPLRRWYRDANWPYVAVVALAVVGVPATSLSMGALMFIVMFFCLVPGGLFGSLPEQVRQRRLAHMHLAADRNVLSAIPPKPPPDEPILMNFRGEDSGGDHVTR